ncbi:hypothetical protein ACWD2L_00515 [Streptomyces sp. NPDC002754]
MRRRRRRRAAAWIYVADRLRRVVDLPLPEHPTVQLTLFDPPPYRCRGRARRAEWCGR